MQVSEGEFRKQVAIANELEKLRQPQWALWRDLADYFLPSRYPWLCTQNELQQLTHLRNTKLLDSTSIFALRTLSAGMMNGITSPSRPWFRLGLEGIQDDELPYDAKLWLETSAKRMMALMSRSNFYQAMGILYLEWPCFGTASMGIFEDDLDVIRCFNFGLGEFYIGVDGSGRVCRHYRKFSRTLEQTATSFGKENLPEDKRARFTEGGAGIMQPLSISHLVTPTSAGNLTASNDAPYQSIYWIDGVQTGEVLAAKPLYDWPFITPRWDVYSNNVYGTSPAMDAIADVIKLQHLEKRGAQGLDKVIDPPMLVSATLANQAKAMHAGETTYVNGRDLRMMAAPAYQIAVPFAELENKVQRVRAQIEQALYNDLFRMISQLQTVRSATEVEYRREEKLTLIGPVLQRFENEAVTPALSRIFNICRRRGLFPQLPPSLQNQQLKVKYISVLSDAQRAAGTLSVERFLQMLGFTAQMAPEVRDVVDFTSMITTYGENIGVPQTVLNDPAKIAEMRAQREQQQSLAQAGEVAPQLASAAESLSNTDVGGGQNVLSKLFSM